MTSGTAPWPIWAVVTVLVAAIGAFGTIVATNPCTLPWPIFCKDGGGSGLPPVDGVSTTYLMDNLEHRRIVMVPTGGNSYRIEESPSSWPWTGTATLDGGALRGTASFLPPSLASMRIEGTVRGDGSIAVRYIFITGSDGQPAGGRVDNHVWYHAV